MPTTPHSRAPWSRLAILSAAAALTLGCAPDPEPRRVGPSAAVAFDGRWMGSFAAAPGFASDGVSCSNASAEFETSGGVLGGTVGTRFGEMVAAGSVGSNGFIRGNLSAPGGASTGSFTGRMTEPNIMQGQYTDTYGCAGTFTLRRL